MIGLVIVSHSAKLAEGVCDLARQVAQGKVLMAAAGGTTDPEHPIGTDAFQVLQAIDSVYSEDGVLVLMDLGSAVLSAGTALELLDQDKQSRVRLCSAPLVEGAVAAASLAAAGASLAEIAREAQNALAGKAAQIDASGGPLQFEVSAEQAGPSEEALVTLTNPLGLHARPAAAGASLAEIAMEAQNALAGKAAQIDGSGGPPQFEVSAEQTGPSEEALVKLINPLGLHARPAASLTAAGAGLAEIAREAQNALAGKAAQIGPSGGPLQFEVSAEQTGPSEEALVKLINPLGLHARPAAQLIRMARRYRAQVTLENVTQRAGPAPGESINGVLALGARQGHQLRIRARGPEAREALAALAGFIASGCGEKEGVAKESPVAAAVSRSQQQLSGIAAAAGIAIGPLVKLRPATVEIASGGAADPEAERQRFMAAVEGAQEETRALYEWSKAHIGAGQAGIFDAQLLFLEDPELIGGVSRLLVADRVAAESAWQAETGRLAGHLAALGDPYLRERAVDVLDVAARVLRRLAGQKTAVQVPREPAILTAHDLTPSQVKDFDPALVLGLCLETGSASAHSAILARALGIPVVAGLGPGISALADGTMAAMDGEQGIVWISPDANQIETLEARRRHWMAARRSAELERHKPATTRDGRRIRVLANISGVAEAAQAVAHGAEGVGVLRTEFLFLGRPAAPDEEEQTEVYRAIAESLGGRPLTVRALDIGGDKSLPYVEIGEEANPFLGWRGIRVLLSRRDLFRTQLRAIMRAGAAQEVELLLPMIASLDELREAKAMAGEAEAELERQGIPCRKNIRIGVMIEVPAAVAVADRLAREASFFSIGSNDLIQYVMAADRTNSRVGPIADPFQPAVLRMIRQAAEAGRQGGIAVALCGELAADPLATPLLLGLGLEEFSVSAPLIPELKRAISCWNLADAEEVAKEALALESSQSVRHLLHGRSGR